MKLSVALCTFNGSAFLPEQLRSITAQTRLPDELVVCDDGSTDGTNRLLEEFASAAPFPVRHYVNERTMGPAKNFDKAIALCNGEIIALADQDDVWDRARLQRTESEFASNAVVRMVFSDADIVDERLSRLGVRAWEIAEFDAEEQELFRHGRGLSVLAKKCVVTGATMAFRSDLRPLILPIPELQPFAASASGHDAWIAMLASATGVAVPIPEALLLYRVHASQLIGVPLERREKERPGSGNREPRGPRFLVQKVPRGLGGHVAGLIRPAIERLEAKRAEFPLTPMAAALLPELKHFDARAMLPSERRRRVGFVARELATGRYHRYGRGFRSALKDLVLPMGASASR